ncbi:MAG: methyltransferase domain-containing protein [Lysobacter sp.]|nr:methyltransferase domain-containing protein [Lysobacter sp.]
MHRQHILTSLIDPQGLGLEVGPSHNPVAAKANGFNVRVVDHLSQAELRSKYEGHNVNIDNIEEVDFIWRGEPLEQILDTTERYDWIIASHVIEHMQDPIRFIRSCQKVLKPEGILSLAIPDKRYCLDYLRPPSSTGCVLQAYLEERKRHTPGQIFDSFSFAAKVEDSISWDPETEGSVDFLHAHGLAGLMLQNYLESSDYVDVHGWVFTPSSFRLIIGDLNALGYLNIREAQFVPTIGCEFFVSFANAPPLGLPNRLELAELAREEAFQPRVSSRSQAPTGAKLERERSWVRDLPGWLRQDPQ